MITKSYTKFSILFGIFFPFFVTFTTFLYMYINRSLWATKLDLLFFCIMYTISCTGITVGFHRLITHKSFKTFNYIKYILAIFGSFALQGSVFTWVGSHRKHHKFTDKEGDPHTPHDLRFNGKFSIFKRFYHAHIGWLYEISDNEFDYYISDLKTDIVLTFISLYHFYIFILGLFLPCFVSFYITRNYISFFSTLIWAGFIRIFLLHHVTWSVNSVCHLIGNRPHYTNDMSTNFSFLYILSFGESWHNNHHRFPNSARHGLHSWQIDLSFFIIKILEKLGLAWDIILPTKRSF